MDWKRRNEDGPAMKEVSDPLSYAFSIDRREFNVHNTLILTLDDLSRNRIYEVEDLDDCPSHVKELRSCLRGPLDIDLLALDDAFDLGWGNARYNSMSLYLGPLQQASVPWELAEGERMQLHFRSIYDRSGVSHRMSFQDRTESTVFCPVSAYVAHDAFGEGDNVCLVHPDENDLPPLFVHSKRDDVYFRWTPSASLVMLDNGFPRLLVRFEAERGSCNSAPLLLQCATYLKMARSIQKEKGVPRCDIVITAILMGLDFTAYRYLVYLDDEEEDGGEPSAVLYTEEELNLPVGSMAELYKLVHYVRDHRMDDAA